MAYALYILILFEYSNTQPFFKGAQVWDFDVLDFNDFFIMKSI